MEFKRKKKKSNPPLYKFSNQAAPLLSLYQYFITMHEKWEGASAFHKKMTARHQHGDSIDHSSWEIQEE